MQRNGGIRGYGKIDPIRPKYDVFLNHRGLDTRHSSTRPKYDVFLNHRGLDTRHSITDILYEFMTDVGIHVFLGDDGFRHSEVIVDEHKRAVNECRIFMVIFSKNYASSTWCLEELAMIFDLYRNAGAAKKMILPIFYDVDLRDVMLRTGLYRGALDENKRKYGPDIVRKWEEALIKVGHTAGWSPTDISGQGKFSKQIVLDVLSKLKIRNRSLPEHLTGIQDQVDEMLKLLNCSSPEIRCVVVHGVSGIGKTTLASTVFNEISSHFEGCSFIPDLRKSSQRRVGFLKLQEKLLDDMLRTTQRASVFTNQKALADATDGIDMIRRRLYGRRVLIVLDDLDKEDQLNKLLGDCDWLGPTTRIIITTTNQSVGDGLMVPGVISTFEMKGLADDRAIQLFSRHAFGEDNLPDDRCRRGI